MGMNPTEPDPHNPSDVASLRVESLARVRGASRGERWFRSLVQNSSDIMMILNADGTVRYVSPAIERVLGYRPEDFVGTRAFDYVHPEDVEHMSKSFAETLEKPGVHPPIEFRIRAADGSWRYMEAIRSNWLHDPHITGVVANVRDITERKEAEERFRSLVQNSSDVITVADVDGTILYDSPAVEKVLGYKPEERVGTNTFEYLGPGESERVTRMLEEVLASLGARLTGQMWWPHKDGSFRYLEVTPTNLLEDPAVRGIVINWRDITKQKEAEETLKKSEERYRSLVELSPDAILVHSEGKVVYANTAGAKLLGADLADELVGKHALDLIHPDYRELARERVHLVLAQEKKAEPVEEKIVCLDGRVMDVEVSGSFILYQGKPAVQNVIRDITERKLTEEALRRSESSLAAAQRIVHLGNWDYDITNDEARWSDEMYRIFGFAPRQFVPRYRTFLTSVHPGDRDLIRGSVRKALYEEEQGKVDYRVVRPDGEVRVVQSLYEVVRDVFGRAVKLTGTVHDITEFKEAEERRREAEERYRVLVETVPAVTYTDRAVGPYTNSALYISPQIEALVGYSVEEWLDPERDLWEESLHPEDRAWVLATDERSKATGEPFAEEYRLIAKDGSAVWVQDEALLVRDAAGRPLSWQGVMLDITERMRAEEEIREANRRLAELAVLRADFTAMVAHELDTPLAVIRGYADVLATGELGPTEQERALAQIQSETKVLNALVEDVRVAASAERRDFVVNPREVPVDELLDDGARFVVTLPGDHPLSVEYASGGARWDGVRAGFADPFIFGDAKGHQVWADRYRIGQVLRNLLANAVKYSPEGSPIGLRAVPGETPGRLRIEVTDRGPGIHPDDMERVFEKFGRGRDPEGRKVAGIGLGLYLSRRILRAHGSDLTISARPDGGSVFSFELEEVER